MNAVWYATRAEQMTRQGPSGRAEQIVRTWIATDLGNTGHVDILLDRYDKDHLQAAGDELADKLDLGWNLD